MMNNATFKTFEYTEESWRKEHDAPLPLEAFEYPIWGNDKQDVLEKQKANQLIEYMGVGALYDNCKDWKPKSYKTLTMKDIRNHRNLPKSFVFDCELSLAAKAQYPVMCCQANFKKNAPFQESRETISRMVGLSTETVRKANNELEQARLITQKKHKGDRWYWTYTADFIRKADIPEWRGDYFKFQRCIIDTGLWSELTLRQQVFYLGLRAVAKPDPDLEEEIMDKVSWYNYEIPYEEWYGWRRFDVWAGSRTKLLKRIGIADVNIRREVIIPLEEAGLVQQLASDYWSVFKVFIRPDDLVHQVTENLKEEILLCEPSNLTM